MYIYARKICMQNFIESYRIAKSFPLCRSTCMYTNACEHPCTRSFRLHYSVFGINLAIHSLLLPVKFDPHEKFSRTVLFVPDDEVLIRCQFNIHSQFKVSMRIYLYVDLIQQHLFIFHCIGLSVRALVFCFKIVRGWHSFSNFTGKNNHNK